MRPTLVAFALALALPAWADEPAPAPAPCPAPAPAPSAEEDVVTLTNGNTFRGTLVEEDPARVVLDVASESGGLSRVTIGRAQISSIVRGRGGSGMQPSVLQREAWFLLRSGGEVVGTRHEVLRTVRVAGAPGFRLEETVVQLPQGRRIPRARFERVEDTDARFLPRRMHYRESVDGTGGDAELPRFERAVSGKVEGDVWRSTWRRGAHTGGTELSLPPETRGVLGLREFLLRSEREPGLLRTQVLDAAEDRLVEVEAGFSVVATEPGGADELQWVAGGARRILSVRGNDVIADAVSEGVEAVPTSAAQAQAVEKASRDAVKDPSVRDVTLAEPGVVLTLPGPDWSAEKALTSGLDAGRRTVARLESPILMADARVEWDPEGLPPARGAKEVERDLIDRLRQVCPDLTVEETRRAVEHLPGAWRMTLSGTLRDTRVVTVALVVPRGQGLVTILVACPESSWEQGRGAVDRLLAGVRPL